jgi:hypothetical protein
MKRWNERETKGNERETQARMGGKLRDTALIIIFTCDSALRIFNRESALKLSTLHSNILSLWSVHSTCLILSPCAFGVALHWLMGSALSNLCTCSNMLAPGPGILLLDVLHHPALWGRHGSTKPHWGHAF